MLPTAGREMGTKWTCGPEPTGQGYDRYPTGSANSAAVPSCSWELRADIRTEADDSLLVKRPGAKGSTRGEKKRSKPKKMERHLDSREAKMLLPRGKGLKEQRASWGLAPCRDRKKLKQMVVSRGEERRTRPQNRTSGCVRAIEKKRGAHFRGGPRGTRSPNQERKHGRRRRPRRPEEKRASFSSESGGR